ncbi:MAG: 3-deoxy-D-manno-octulosonic acid transferase [Flavobacteriales bacterium]|nr:MAG: 3-deoxy-D-manno-octulosonic acid transferase [Flavobacteriales bacterium]
MQILYNIVIFLVKLFLPIAAVFNKKLTLFVRGRKSVFTQLANTFGKDDNILWFHAASLGEFEQGRPIIEACKKQFPKYKFLLTFFSPSGYEVRKDYNTVDLVTYLPLDTKKNMQRFLKVAHPKMAIIVKYEFWPNLLQQLKKMEIPTLLVSAIFRKNQIFFKPYGRFMRNSLDAFKHFFVQSDSSKKLLKNIGIQRVTVSGDTRFDRVFQITKEEINLPVLETFTKNKITVIAGSTWPKDEELLINFINENKNGNVNFIIAPHEVNENHVNNIISKISKKAIALSKATIKNVKNHETLVIDSIGLLSKIYYYGDIAYIGGGFGVGIHNVLEPATFGIPVIIGPNYKKFNEAAELIATKACLVVSNQTELAKTFEHLINNESDRQNKGKLAATYVKDKIGATQTIMHYIYNSLEEK